MALPLIFFMTVMAVSCKDDEIIQKDEEKTDPDEEYMEGYSIGFKLKVPTDISTRAGGVEDYEDYIDIRNKFRVFFFTEDGEFLFGAIDRIVTSITDQNVYDGAKYWYVRVPVNYIVDRDGKPFNVEEIRDYLCKNPFKIAVLANWPNDGFVTTDNSGDDDNKGEGIDLNYINREPNWGYLNSKLCPEGTSGRDVKNINDLHHLVVDSYYNNKDNLGDKDQRPARIEVYDFIMDGDVEKGQGKMGVQTDWVKMKLDALKPNAGQDGRDVADAWIRDNWNPDKREPVGGEFEPKFQTLYDNIWQLWDFEASYRYPSDNNAYNKSWSNVGNKWGAQWYTRNGYTIRSWMSRTVQRGPSNPIDGLEFYPSSRRGNSSRSGNGIILDVLEDYSTDENKHIYVSTTGHTPTGYFKFTAPSTGTLKIRWSTTASFLPSTASLTVQRSSNVEKIYTTTGTSTSIVNIGSEKDGYYRNISITEDPEPIYIFCSSGSIIIYSIEWVSNKYLYDTYREGITPSETQPIPMYGVQDFKKLNRTEADGSKIEWVNGSTFNLSSTENGGGNISLIRALAKVEVYLPTKAEFIYMRSMNRMASSEPMDVENPTDKFWDNDNHTSGKCEWFGIQNYGTGFNQTGGDPKSKDELKDYTNWLSWFYGSWTESSKKWNFRDHNIYNGTSTTPSSYNVTLPSKSGNGYSDYPHLFNPVINRSDFCEMIYVGQVSGRGHKYILYLPEKNIVDPNYVGVSSSIAKIAHIEYRYPGETTKSLEDNYCHRIYFTNYSSNASSGPVNSKIKSVKRTEFESNYEKLESNLKLHWPIMRNHIYEFNVGGTGPSETEIQVKVKDWGYERIDFTW